MVERVFVMGKQKYYVVWVGKQTGVFTSWEDCKKQVIGVKGAKYKSFTSREEAEGAFKKGASSSPKQNAKKEPSGDFTYIKKSLSVDAACSGNPGVMEYRGVHTESEEELFHFGPVQNGTNNIGEFLAIVHALALLKQKSLAWPVYSDSRTAISWVRKKRANTSIERNESTEKLWNVIHRAEKWLEEHTYKNQILKWETKVWGESKADFGRK